MSSATVTQKHYKVTPPPFSILDYLDRLTPVPNQKGQFYCPCCEGKNLTYSTQTQRISNQQRKTGEKPKPKPAPLPVSLTLAILPEPATDAPQPFRRRCKEPEPQAATHTTETNDFTYGIDGGEA